LDRAQREAARRRIGISDWKDNLGSWNSSRSNATWKMTPKIVPWNPLENGIASAYTERAIKMGQFNEFMMPITFSFVDQSSSTFFAQRGTGCTWSTRAYVSDFRHVEPFRRHSRSKSKVVRNHAKFSTFFAIPNFRGRAFQKLYPFYYPCIAARRLEKFREDTPTRPEVIGAHTMNFRPILNFHDSIFLGEPRTRWNVR